MAARWSDAVLRNAEVPTALITQQRVNHERMSPPGFIANVLLGSDRLAEAGISHCGFHVMRHSSDVEDVIGYGPATRGLSPTVTRANTAHPEVTVRQTTHPTYAPSAVDHCRRRACRGCAALAPTTVCRPVASMLKRKRRDAGSAGVRASGVVDSLPLPTQRCCACRIIDCRCAAGNAYKPRVTSDAHADSPGSPGSRGCAPSAGLLRPRCLRPPRSPPAACPWR